ncbi:MAG: glycosyltransferase family 4 protein [Pseudomonadota bacterium]|nr:glycosyltransferase family 4 protein [Pseudomonadota bacterium]
MDGPAVVKLRTGVACLTRLVRLLWRGQVALVHIHVAQRTSCWRKGIFQAVAKVGRVPVVLHLHGSEFRQFYGDECGPFRRWLVRRMFQSADQVILLSSQWREWMECNIPRARVVVVPNPAVCFVDQRRAEPLVVFLGRLGRRKGVYDLIDAFAALGDVAADWRLILAGDGEVDAVRRRVGEMGLDGRVSVPGWVGPEARSQLLSRAGIYVLPSYDEGLPMGLLEAMAAGIAVVSTPIGGIPDAVRDGAEGVLVTPGDVPALSDALARLMSDEKLRHRLGEAAARRVEADFSLEASAVCLTDLYRHLVVGSPT